MGTNSSVEIGAVGNEAVQPEAVVHDLAIITVSTNEAQWIRPCLRTVFTHIGDVSVDVVVVDNDSTRRDRRSRCLGVPGRPRGVVAKSRVLAREQPRADDL